MPAEDPANPSSVIPDAHRQFAGLRPVLFSWHGLDVSSYGFFMVAGIVAALTYFWWQKPKPAKPERHAWLIIPAALFCGSLGAKLMSLTLQPSQLAQLGWGRFLYSGRTIVGGLLAGWLGVFAVKRLLGIRSRYGNTIAPAACLGIALGRIGCFLGSCCWGKPTALPLAVDFGDGQFRHPTQLYEAAFMLGLFGWLHLQTQRELRPGILFRRFLLGYFCFRFGIEFIRDEPRLWLGLTVFQLIAAGVVIFLTVTSRLTERNAPLAPASAAASAARTPVRTE